MPMPTRKWPIEVWVCPNCGNYYGATTAGDLSKKMNTNSKNEPTFTRDRCPHCGDKRVLCGFEVELVARETRGAA